MQLRNFRGKRADFWEIVVRNLEIRGFVKVLTGMEGAWTNEPEPDPDPFPVVTIQPGDPEKPEEPPAEPMGEPDSNNDCLPDPELIGRG